MDYSPFGQLIAQYKFTPAGSTMLSRLPFGFSTKYTDAESGLLYYGYRYYDSVVGRWPSRDPIGEEGGLNLYGFVGNRGMNRVDSLGLVVVMFPPPGHDPLAGLVWRLSQLLQSDYLLPRLLEHWIHGDGKKYDLTYGDVNYITKDEEDGQPIWDINDFPKANRAFLLSQISGQTVPIEDKHNYYSDAAKNSIGQFNIEVKGTVKCVNEEGGTMYVYSGTFQIVDEKFDFDLGKVGTRGLMGEAKTLAGLLLLSGGGKPFDIYHDPIEFTQTDRIGAGAGRGPRY